MPPPRPLALFAIAVTSVFASAGLGGATNAINGAVSPLYFVSIMDWHGVEDVWRASIGQGILEGLCFGVFVSSVFTIGAGLITQVGCTYGFAARHLLAIVAGSFVCWLIGGL